MKIVKGGNIQFDANRLFDMLFDEIYETSVIGARRMESDARTFLIERTKGPKSSGTLAESIKGFVEGVPGGVAVGVSASAIETGQWEESQGEPEEAASTRGSGTYDYARAVEEGTGEIRSESGGLLRFWTGRRGQRGGKEIIRTSSVAGQEGKKFLEDAVITAMPSFRRLLSKVGSNIRVSQIIRTD